MALPKQVREQVEEADRILAQMHGTPAEEPPEEPELVVVDNEAPADESTVTVEDAPTVEASDSPTAETVEVEPPKEEPPAEVTDEWERKYRILQGKYDSEVPQLHAQLRSMNQQMDELKDLISNLQAAPATDKTDSASALVTADEIEAFGSEFMDVVGRRAKEVSSQEVASLKNELAELKQQLGQTSQRIVESDRDKVIAKLDSEVEDWRTINTQPEFLDWLDQNDAYSGVQRGKMLTEAFESNNANRVVAFFTGFKNEHAAVAPVDPDSASVKANRKAETPAVDLSTQVAPGRAPRTPTPASAQEPKRMWTRADIVEFYKDVQLGKFKDEPKKQRAIEEDILLAQREGRLK